MLAVTVVRVLPTLSPMLPDTNWQYVSADVGGGSVPNDTPHALADISLRWLVREVAAAQCGIQFDSDALARASIPETAFSRDGFPLTTYFNATRSSVRKAHSPPPLVIHTGSATTKEMEARASSEETPTRSSTDPKVDPNDDALQPIHDQLKLDPVWWLLEIVPTDHSWQNGKGVWIRKWGFHCGRGRRIPDTGEQPMFHESVKRRMESALAYKPKAVWKGDPMFVA